MPSINLPTITINKEDFKSKETMENILDTLMKYRKELNYLLMNLDIDNMPLVGGLIGDIEGNHSLLSQTIDGIYAQVGNIEGDLSQLQVEADNITAMVANNSGDIASLSIKADSIETIVTNNTGAISAVTQTANGLVSTVADLNTSVGGFYSEVNQLASSITSKVSYTDYTGATLVSMIEQTAASIKLSASKIDLTGITRISSPTNPTNNYFSFFGNGVSLYEAGIRRLQIYYNGTSTVFSDGPRIDFNVPVSFNSGVDGLTARFG